MKKAELLLPAGNELCLRAAVNNGADAVYFGLSAFNARRLADNFKEEELPSIVKYCHERKVRVYMTLNTLVKDHELPEFFRTASVIAASGADAIIIQDPCFAGILREKFPKIEIHLSTQSATMNMLSVPQGVSRVILPRELKLEEIEDLSNKITTEIFVHGALCFSYSGLCLFSSIAGGRSGNRGMCAQPCRKVYNGKYGMSTMDLCMLQKLPELMKAGVSAFKVEGRMRTPEYVGIVGRIYRKYINQCTAGKLEVEESDLNLLRIVFNREFTTGFAFNETIIDSRRPMNRGLYLGKFGKSGLRLENELKVGDGVGIWINKNVVGHKLTYILKNGSKVQTAKQGDLIEIERKGAKEGDEVYKTSSIDLKVELGDEIKKVKVTTTKTVMEKLEFPTKVNSDSPRLFVKVYDRKSAIEADKARADVVYYDLQNDDIGELIKALRHARLYVFTPRIASDKELESQARRISEIKPDGVLAGNRGLLELLKNIDIHLDYNNNCFNDIDLNCYTAIPMISPELNLHEMKEMRNKVFITIVHGELVLMTTKENLGTHSLVDSEGRKFPVRRSGKYFEVLNCQKLGLLNKTREYLAAGIKYFYIDCANEDAGKLVHIYKQILNRGQFNDNKIRKGYTTGHFSRGVF